MAIRKKRGVKLPNSPFMAPALQIADYFGDVVTSGREGYRGDGVHTPNSLHYDGLAIDIRPYWDDVQGQIMDYLNVGYNVLNEGNHLHVSYDPEGLRL